MQSIIVSLWGDTLNWLDPEWVNSLSVFDKMIQLSKLYLKFHVFGYNLDNAWTSGIFEDMWEGSHIVLEDGYFWTVQRNVMENWLTQQTLAWGIPGESCEHIGARIGIMLRTISGYGLKEKTMLTPDWVVPGADDPFSINNAAAPDHHPVVGASKPIARTWESVAR